MNDIYTVLLDMPPGVEGQVRRTASGDYYIFLNACHTVETQKEAYDHEVRHILSGHYEDERQVQELELEADRLILFDEIMNAEANGLPIKAKPLPATTTVPAKPARDWKKELRRLKRQSLTGMYY